MIGVRSDSRTEFVATPTGAASPPSRGVGLLRNCRRRGMIAGALTVGDGAGFRRALLQVLPETPEAASLVPQVANIFAAPPKSVHPEVRSRQ